jgi:hypothetical protein
MWHTVIMFYSRVPPTKRKTYISPFVTARAARPRRQIVTPEYLRKNWGVVVAVGLLYIAFLTSLALIRHRRIKECHAYIA